MIEPILWYWMAAPAVLVAYSLLAGYSLRRRVRDLEDTRLRLETKLQEATALTVEAVRTNRALRARLKSVEERLGQVELASGGRPYDQAISLAEAGEAPERLASCFGLTMGEANLVSLLHGAAK